MAAAPLPRKIQDNEGAEGKSNLGAGAFEVNPAVRHEVKGVIAEHGSPEE